MEAADVLDAYAAAWTRGEPEAAFELYADDVVMNLPGRGALAGTHRGREAVVATIQALLARTDGLPVEVEVVDRLVSRQRVALFVRERTTRGGRVLDVTRVNVYRVRGGQICEIDVHEGDQYAVDDFFG
jgi:ketosteroid isomerase-like protein